MKDTRTRNAKPKAINLSDLVYRKLRELITNGKLNPGEKIVESKFLEKFGVSRTPFREAIKTLEAKGFVETIYNRGIYVKNMSVTEFEKIYDVLSVLEGYAANLTAKIITDKQINKLEIANNKMKKLHELGIYKTYAENNTRFHLLFPHFCKNSLLRDLIHETRDRVYRYRFARLANEGRVQDFLSEHEAIINAIKQRRPEKAEEKMKQHIQRSKSILADFLRDYLT